MACVNVMGGTYKLDDCKTGQIIPVFVYPLEIWFNFDKVAFPSPLMARRDSRLWLIEVAKGLWCAGTLGSILGFNHFLD